MTDELIKPAYRLNDGPNDKGCVFCGKPVEPYLNYCNWGCHIEHAKQLGGEVITPNGLPIKCIKWDNSMLEHEHGDEPEYKWPVEVQYIGPITADHRDDAVQAYGLPETATDEEVREISHETHALLHSDEVKSVTIYECCYYAWDTKTGKLLTGPTWYKPEQWKLVSVDPPAKEQA